MKSRDANRCFLHAFGSRPETICAGSGFAALVDLKKAGTPEFAASRAIRSIANIMIE